MFRSKLGFGPMSKEAVEAVFSYSHNNHLQLMLISTHNQIGMDSGYVCTTKEYGLLLKTMKCKYPNSSVKICRDHCGPGFRDSKTDNMGDIREEIRCDIENGFDLIHIDLCRTGLDHEEKIEQTIGLMEFSRSIKSDIMFEVGTEENRRTDSLDAGIITMDMEAFSEAISPVFYVVKTGSLVMETSNTGQFDRKRVLQASELLRKYGVLLKEHNADYLCGRQIRSRLGVVDAMNIAPQLGVVQTNCVLSQCVLYGVPTDAFAEHVSEIGRWIKWVTPEHKEDHMLRTMVAGHYHHSSDCYDELICGLRIYLDIDSLILREITKVIDHYARCFDANSR